MSPDMEALEALLAKATPGPWTASECMDIWIEAANGRGVAKLGDHEWCSAENESSVNTEAEMRANARLFLAAVNAMPGLIAALRAKDAEMNPDLEARIGGQNSPELQRRLSIASHGEPLTPEKLLLARALAVANLIELGWPDNPSCLSDAQLLRDLIAALRAKDGRIAELDEENDLIAQLGRDRIAALEAEVNRYAKALRPFAAHAQRIAGGGYVPARFWNGFDRDCKDALALLDPPGDKP